MINQERLQLINIRLNDPNSSIEGNLDDLNYILANLDELRANFDYSQELFEEFLFNKKSIPWGLKCTPKVRQQPLRCIFL